MLRLTQAGAKLLPGWTGRPQSRALITHCSRPERPDLRKLAEMAHISISDAEVEEWEPKVQQVVDWFDQLQSMSLEDSEATVLPESAGRDRLRPDTPEVFHNRGDLVEAFPVKKGSLNQVPRVLSNG